MGLHLIYMLESYLDGLVALSANYLSWRSTGVLLVVPPDDTLLVGEHKAVADSACLPEEQRIATYWTIFVYRITPFIRPQL